MSLGTAVCVEPTPARAAGALPCAGARLPQTGPFIDPNWRLQHEGEGGSHTPKGKSAGSEAGVLSHRGGEDGSRCTLVPALVTVAPVHLSYSK